MEHSKEQILQMLNNGVISAEDADRLLSAVEGDSVQQEAVEPVNAVPIPSDLPHISQYRKGWQVPFVGSLLVLAFSGRRVLKQGERGFLGKLMLPVHWMLFSLAGLGALLSLWSRDARWLYVDIQQDDGRHFELSFPVPVQLLTGLINAIRPFVDGEEGRQLELAAEFIQAMQDHMDSPEGEPVMIDINDEDSRVKVYFI